MTVPDLQGRDAGIVSRLAAAAVDLVVVLAVLGTVYTGIAAFGFLLNPRSFHWPANLGWSVPVVGTVIAAPYLAIAWSASGRTVGDVLFGLRVVSRRGARVALPRALARACLCLVLPIGLLWIPFSSARRSVQDTLVRTRVIYDWNPGGRPRPSRSPGQLRPGRG